MVALDTSTLIAFFRGDTGPDVEALDRALELGQAILPPVVVTEILSDPKIDRRVATAIRGLPVLEVVAGFWQRAAATRMKILSRGLRARLADTLISQTCLDHHTPLITRDRDFRHFALHAGLELI